MRNSFSKTALILSLGIAMIICLTSCKAGEQMEYSPAEYPEYSAVDNEELGCVELEYEGVIYRPYGVFNTNDYRGKQIGFRAGDPDSIICEVVGYSSDEWIIEYLDVLMGGGDMLLKSIDVTQIPTELEQFKEYDY